MFAQPKVYPTLVLDFVGIGPGLAQPPAACPISLLAGLVAATKRWHAVRHRITTMLMDLASPPLPSAPVTLLPDQEDERALVAMARNGDVGAFERLYHRHAGRVFALCVRMTADRGRARELTQDVFVHAWERLGTFRGDAALGSWLHRIAVNAVLMSTRSDKRRHARVALVDDLRPPSRDGERPRAEVNREGGEGEVPPIDVDQAIDLERAIAALPPGVRRAFVLHDIEGYRHQEIAQMTGSAEGTLRAQLHRARRLLMEALK